MSTGGNLKKLLIGVAALVVVVLAFARLQDKPPADAPKCDGVETALVIAWLGDSDDLAPLDRYRIGAIGPGLCVFRRYVVGDDVSEDEARVLLGVPSPTPGQKIEIRHSVGGLAGALVPLLDPNANTLERAGLHCGTSGASIVARFRDAGVDLDNRTIGGAAMSQLKIGNSWSEPEIVEVVDKPVSQISLAHARLLDPTLTIGSKLKLPTSRQGLKPLIERYPHLARGPERWRAIAVHSFEVQRRLMRPAEKPKSLAALFSGDVFQFYPEGHGVLYIDVGGDQAQKFYETLVTTASVSGWSPIIIGGSVADATFAWQHERHAGLQAGTHAMDTPQVVLQEAAKVDVKALLAKNPTYSDINRELGQWPKKRPTIDEFSALYNVVTKKLHPRIRIALVPVDSAWKALAYMPNLVQAGEATPSLAQAVAVSKYWQDKYGARVAVVGPATIEWKVDHAPTSNEDALELAREHIMFTPEGGADSLRGRAYELKSPVWYAWWD